MGECINVGRGGKKKFLPTLNANYPQDKSLTFISGNTASATFEVKIATDGYPVEYTYQWYVNNAAVSGATGTSYTWSGTSGGTYSIRCDVTNKAGTVQSRTATLTANMQYTPTLNGSYPANVTSVRKDANTTLKVEISKAGNPTSYTYQWYKNGSAISGATSSTYSFSLKENAGTYTFYCKVTNAAGTVQSRTATVILQSETKYLYNAGTENVAWTYNNQNNGNGIVQNRDGAIEFYHGSWASGGTGIMLARTTSTIDLTIYKKLCFEINITKVSSINPWLGVTSNAAKWNSVTWLASYEDKSYNNTHTVTIDISSLTSGYVAMRHEGNAFITKVYLVS